MKSAPIPYDLGTYTLPSGQHVHISASVVVDLHVERVPAGERGPFLDDVMPQAMERLRQHLSRLTYEVATWKDI
jgi:hypothetical protein